MAPAKPQILCLHGGGTSAAIFFAQTRKIRSTLQHQFEFIYVNAPIKSGPGPGVLPFFKDSGPFYRWFSEAAATDPSRRDIEINGMNDAIQTALKRQGRRSDRIVGVLGFSQGCIASTLLLWQHLRGDAKWASLRFGALICGGGGGDMKSIIGQQLDVPTVHLHGLQDPILSSSRMLVDTYNPEAAVIMEFDGGHHIPTQLRDIEMLGAFMIDSCGMPSMRRKDSAKVISMAFHRRKSSARPSMGARGPSFSAQRPGMGARGPSFNAQRPGMGARGPSFGGQRPCLGLQGRRRSSARHLEISTANRRSSVTKQRDEIPPMPQLSATFKNPFSGQLLPPRSPRDIQHLSLKSPRTPRGSMHLKSPLKVEFTFNESIFGT